jgi:peptide/nickel transport system permease protein
MALLAYLARRVAQAVLILLGITVVTYVLLYLIPADPARQIAGRSATAATVASIREQLGLDLPLWQQYLRYLGNLLRGDLGRSYIQRTRSPPSSPAACRPPSCSWPARSSSSY